MNSAGILLALGLVLGGCKGAVSAEGGLGPQAPATETSEESSGSSPSPGPAAAPSAGSGPAPAPAPGPSPEGLPSGPVMSPMPAPSGAPLPAPIPAPSPDTTPPGDFALNAPAAASNVADLVVTWTSSPDAVAYDLSLHSTPGCMSQTRTLRVTAATQGTLTAITEGAHQVCLTAIDAAGNERVASSNDVAISIDRTPPGTFDVTVPSEPWTTTQPTLTWTAAADAASYSARLSTSAGCATTVQTAIASPWTPAALAEGTYYLCVTASDTLGNPRPATTASAPFSVSLPRTATISNAPTGVSAATTIDVTIGGADVATYRYKLGSSATTTCTDATGYSAARSVATHITDEQIRIPDGLVRLCVLGLKADGVAQAFASASTVTWTRDGTPPVVAFDVPPEIGPATTAGGTTAIAGHVIETSPLAVLEVSVQKDAEANGCLNVAGTAFDQACPHWIDVLGATSAWTLTVDDTAFTANASYTLRGRGTDDRGNATAVNPTRTVRWNEDVVRFVTEQPVRGAPQSESIRAAALDAAGNLFVVGDAENRVHGSSSSDWWIRKISPDGVEDVIAWNKFLNGNSLDSAKAIAIAPDGSIYVGGYGTQLVASNGGGRDLWIRKFAASGVEVTAGWPRVWNGPYSYDDEINALAVDASNNVYVVGYGSYLLHPSGGMGVDITHKDWWLKKLSSAGNEIWDKKIDANNGVSGHDDVATAAAIDGAGKLYVAGYRTDQANFPASRNWWIKKYELDGTEITTGWNKTIDGNGFADEAAALAIGPSNTVYVAGFGEKLASATSGQDWLVKMFDTNGTELWDLRFDGNGGADQATAIRVDAAGVAYVGGWGTNLVGGASGRDWWIRKVSAGGSLVAGFDLRFDARNNSDTLYALALTADGTGLYAVGDGYNLAATESYYDAWIKRFAADGTEDRVRWNFVTSFTGETGLDRFNDVAVDAAGNVYMVGCRTAAVGYDADMLVRKFSPAGVEETGAWPKVIDGAGGHDCANAVAVDPVDGRIVVVGRGEELFGASSLYDCWMKGFSAAGAELWDHRFDGGFICESRDVAIAADRSVYVVGDGFSIANVSSWNDWIIKKFTHDGAEITTTWPIIVDSPGTASFDQASAVAIDATGNVYVGGYGHKLFGFMSSFDYRIKKFSSAGVEDTGFEKIVDAYNGVTALITTATHLIAASNGYNLVNGSTQGDVRLVGYLLSNGNEDAAWAKTLDGNGAGDYVSKLALDGAGNVYVGGSAQNMRGASSGYDFWVRSFDGSGNALPGELRLDANGGSDQLTGLDVTAGGRIHVVGQMTDARGVAPLSGSNAVWAAFDP